MIVSNCCGAVFNEPGYPDTDLCSACHEHSDGIEQDEPSIQVLEMPPIPVQDTMIDDEKLVFEEEYNYNLDVNTIVKQMMETYNTKDVNKLIHAMHGHIASLMMDITGMREMTETDWEEECSALYDFLCEHKPHKYYKQAQLLDEYHEWDKKQNKRRKS